MKLNLKKVPILTSALFLLFLLSLCSCNLEPRQPEDKRERNFKYRQQVLNQEDDNNKETEDELNDSSSKQPVKEKETLFGEIVDPRFSQQTLKLSEQEIKQLNLLSSQNPEPLSAEAPKDSTTSLTASEEPASKNPSTQDIEPSAPEEEPQKDPSETPPTETLDDDDSTQESPPSNNLEESPDAESQEDSEHSSQPDHDSKTNKEDTNEQNPSDGRKDSDDQQEEQPETKSSSKKPKTPPKSWNIDIIDVDS